MRNFRILAGFMVVFLVAFMSLSAAAHAKDDDDSGSGKKKGKKLPKHARVLQAQINDNKALIENIELTPGPQGLKGDPGADSTVEGPQGPKGDPGTDGVDGQSIQGPQGEPGTSSWFDGFETVTTTGSVQVGNDTADCTSANEGTIRFNTAAKTLEVCDGTVWAYLNATEVPEKVDADNDGYYTDIYYSEIDCDDNDYNVNPGATEIRNDGLDNDCNPNTSDGDYYQIGDTGPAGGIVFYITDGGQHGLEVASADQSSAVEWGCSGHKSDAEGTALGTGASNTVTIVEECQYTAASIAYNHTEGGFSDWYLPSKDELNLLWYEETVAVQANMDDEPYWTSSQRTNRTAWIQSFDPFDGGRDEYENKSICIRVRAVRAF